jgi:hypothetical protein
MSDGVKQFVHIADKDSQLYWCSFVTDIIVQEGYNGLRVEKLEVRT